MKLYELTEAMRDFELEVDEDGVITNGDELDALKMKWEEKMENVALYIKNLRAEAEAVKKEKQALADRQRVLDNKADWLKQYLQNNLHGEKYSTSRVAISYRKSQAVVCEAPEKLPEQYQRIKVEADKTALKDALKAGEVIDGARLEDNVSIIIK